MSRLRLVPAPAAPVPATAQTRWVADGRPRVSLRLLMAASGRCSCDECLLAYRAGDKRAGIIKVASPRPRLAVVR